MNPDDTAESMDICNKILHMLDEDCVQSVTGSTALLTILIVKCMELNMGRHEFIQICDDAWEKLEAFNEN